MGDATQQSEAKRAIQREAAGIMGELQQERALRLGTSALASDLVGKLDKMDWELEVVLCHFSRTKSTQVK